MVTYRLCFLLFYIVFFFSCVTSKSLKRDSGDGAFSKNQIALIMSDEPSEPMRVLKINNRSDSIILRTQSTSVNIDFADRILQNFVNRLYSTVRDSMSMGVGIAAPQVGILKNIIWVQRFDKEDFPFEVYLNPKIIQYSDKKQECQEGCLSIPNRSDILNSRAYSIIIEYDKLDKTHHTETVEDFTAVIFQHEIDHLSGILYLDHLEKEINQAKQRSKF